MLQITSAIVTQLIITVHYNITVSKFLFSIFHNVRVHDSPLPLLQTRITMQCPWFKRQVRMQLNRIVIELLISVLSQKCFVNMNGKIHLNAFQLTLFMFYKVTCILLRLSWCEIFTKLCTASFQPNFNKFCAMEFMSEWFYPKWIAASYASTLANCSFIFHGWVSFQSIGK